MSQQPEEQSEDARAEAFVRGLLADRPMKARELVNLITGGRDSSISEEAAKSAILKMLKYNEVVQDATGCFRLKA